MLLVMKHTGKQLHIYYHLPLYFNKYIVVIFIYVTYLTCICFHRSQETEEALAKRREADAIGHEIYR